MPDTPRVHLLIPTHVTRHLGACLASIALQTRPPDSVTLTTDGHGADGSIAELIAELWPRVASSARDAGREPPPLVHTARDHQGEPRLNQVRNNGLRAIEACFDPRPQDLVLVLDGDTLLAPETVAQHAAHAERGAELVIPYRFELDPAQTGRVRTDALLDPRLGPALVRSLATRPQRVALGRRHARYVAQHAGRRFGLGDLGMLKPHKPKTIGGHHAVGVRALRDVNGYDERYQGSGFDDDDLSRRLHALRPRLRLTVAVRGTHAYHLYHETRRPHAITAAPDYRLFQEPWSVTAAHGWRTPRPQPEPTVRWVPAS
ncbi:MAG: hypothetical protein EA378_04395 [Phycisphaerales bacterium]|nr:MAG: hypothetical protein EA378_04395 [Phycisphaerales bacterium]